MTDELLVQATQDISQLIRDEMQMAMRDFAESGTRVGSAQACSGSPAPWRSAVSLHSSRP